MRELEQRVRKLIWLKEKELIGFANLDKRESGITEKSYEIF